LLEITTKFYKKSSDQKAPSVWRLLSGVIISTNR